MLRAAQVERPSDALKDCEKALEKDWKHVKALYRKASALVALGQWEDAKASTKQSDACLGSDRPCRRTQTTIDKCLEHDPENRAVKKLQLSLRARVKEQASSAQDR